MRRMIRSEARAPLRARSSTQSDFKPFHTVSKDFMAASLPIPGGTGFLAQPGSISMLSTNDEQELLP
jgi:hypothetical protein